MTKDEALKLARGALESCGGFPEKDFDVIKVETALAAINEALAQPEQSVVRMPTSADEAAAMQMLGFAYLQHHAPERLAQDEQEPVAWGYRGKDGEICDCISPKAYASEWNEGDYQVPLYTTPPKREWVKLTDEDMYELGEFRNAHGYVPTSAKRLFARIDAKLKEKNT